VRDANRFTTAHARSYGFRVPQAVLAVHSRRTQKWFSEIEAWSVANRVSITVLPAPLGDPHLPDGLRSAEIRVGPARRRFIWKPGVDRYAVESACQRIIEILGPESGLLPISGFEIAGGGAWKKVSEAKAAPSLDQVGRSFAHLLLLVVAFGLDDIHHENLLWDGQHLRVIDAETFAGPNFPPRTPPPLPRRLLFSDRVARSAMLTALNGYHRDWNRAAAHILPHLEEAHARVLAHWPELLAIREGIAGKSARRLRLQTAQMFKLMPFALDPKFRAAAWREFVTHVDPTIDLEAAFSALENACIPLHHEAIPPAAGHAHEPDLTMLDFLKGFLRSADLYGNSSLADLEYLLQAVRSADHQSPREPVCFEAIGSGGVAMAASYASPGLCFGLGGLAYLHAAEVALGRAHQVPASAEVMAGLPWALRNTQPLAGIYQGVGGDLLLGWALNRLGALTPALQRAFDERLGYVPGNRGPVLDLGHGLAGELLGLARASEFLTHRRGDLSAWAQERADLIQAEATALLAESRLNPENTGFAHGLAGAVLALHSAHGALGIAVPSLAGILAQLGDYLGLQDPSRLPRLPFCRDSAAILAVLRAVNHHEGWAPGYPAHSMATTNGCCGATAYHLAQLIPMEMDLLPDPAGQWENAPFGYLGEAGHLAIKLARFGPLPDPIWGRDLLPAITGN